MPIHRLKRHPRSVIGLILLIGAIAAAVIAGDWMDTAMLVDQGRALTRWVGDNTALALVLYLAFVTLGKVGPVPGGLVIILIGGFLFGAIPGALLAALGSGLSAMMVTVVCRRYFVQWLDDRYGDRIQALSRAVGRDAFWLMLAIRVTPLVPAWFGNVVPVPLAIRPAAVWLATSLGVLPICLVVGQLGAELQSLTEIATISPMLLLEPSIIGPLMGLTALSLLPILVRRKLFKAQPEVAGSNVAGSKLPAPEREDGRL